MDRGGRRLGMVVFLLGIVLLILVFVTAYRMFGAPISGLPSGESTIVTASQLGAAAVTTLVKVALLFVMTVAGSLIAARGIHIFLGSACPPAESDSSAPSK